MIKYDDILESYKYVVDNSKHVKINSSNIKKINSLFQPIDSDFKFNLNFLGLNHKSNKELLIYFIICNSLNFCFFGTDPKWQIEFKGEFYSGSWGLFYAIAKNADVMLDLDYLKTITKEELNLILKGTSEISILDKRYDILMDVTKEMMGIKDLEALFKNANDENELLNIIVETFSNFRDISIYKGRKIYFFKRANLFVQDLVANFPFISDKIKNIDHLFGCADYKIPQVLRSLGILEYSEELANKIDSLKSIIHDSEEEIEIRANMLYAIEMIKKELLLNKIKMSSIGIDNYLWLLSKNKTHKDKPHHLTITTYY